MGSFFCTIEDSVTALSFLSLPGLLIDLTSGSAPSLASFCFEAVCFVICLTLLATLAFYGEFVLRFMAVEWLTF
jgi:hypothetical protein